MHSPPSEVTSRGAFLEFEKEGKERGEKKGRAGLEE